MLLFLFLVLIFRVLNRFQKFVLSTSQRIETKQETIRNWMHHNENIDRISEVFSVCDAVLFIVGFSVLSRCRCQKGEGSQMMMNALMSVRDIFYLEWGRMRKTHKICLRVFDWRFSMEKRSACRLFGSFATVNTHKHISIYMICVHTVVSRHMIPMSGVTSNKKIGLESLNKCSSQLYKEKTESLISCTERNEKKKTKHREMVLVPARTTISICLVFLSCLFCHLSCGAVYVHLFRRLTKKT